MDDFITLGDGKVKVEEDVIVSGSRISVRDHFPILTAQQEDEALRKALQQPHGVIKIPGGMKYCASGLKHEPPFADAILPLDAFGDDSSRPDGKRPVCNACRAEMGRRSYARWAAEQGRVVKTYNPRSIAP